MIGDFPLVELARNGGAGLWWALLALAIVLIMRGQLVPGRLYRERVEQCEQWRQAYLAERDKLERLMIPVGEVTIDVLRSLPPAVSKPRSVPLERAQD